jgi:hypothetical protein
MKAKALKVLKRTYFPTIKGKRVDVVTTTTVNGIKYKKNLDNLKYDI